MLRKSSVYARTQTHWHAIDSGILLCQYLVCGSQQINQFVRGYHSCRRRSFCSSLVLSKVRPSWPFLSIQRPPPKYLSFFFSHGWSEIKQLSIMNKVWLKIVVVKAVVYSISTSNQRSILRFVSGKNFFSFSHRLLNRKKNLVFLNFVQDDDREKNAETFTIFFVSHTLNYTQ